MYPRRLVPAVVLGLVAVLVVAGGARAWSWPVGGEVLRAFSLGADPYAGGQHRGIDVRAADGESIAAPAAGTVTFVGTVPTHGRAVTITTPDGYAVSLTHLGETRVAKGQSVAEGATIGTVGTSGSPEHAEPYVHLGIRVASEPEGYLDPLRFLPPRSRPASPAPAPAPEQAPAPSVVSAAPPAADASAATPPVTAAAPVPAPAVVAAGSAPVDVTRPIAPPADTAGSPAPSPVPAATIPAPTHAQSAPVVVPAMPQSTAAPNPRATGAVGGSVPQPSAESATETGPGSGASPETPPARSGAVGVEEPAASTPVPAAAPAPLPVVHAVGSADVDAGTARWASPPIPMARSTSTGRVVHVAAGDGRRPRVVPRTGTRGDVAQPRERVPEATPGPAPAATRSSGVRAPATQATPVSSGLSSRSGGAPRPHPTMARLPGARVGELRPSDEGVSPVVGGAMLLGLGMLLAAATAAAGGARRIGRDEAVLRHDAHLLRQLHAAHRSRIHDHRGGHRRATPAPAGP